MEGEGEAGVRRKGGGRFVALDRKSSNDATGALFGTVKSVLFEKENSVSAPTFGVRHVYKHVSVFFDTVYRYEMSRTEKSPKRPRARHGTGQNILVN